MNKFLGTGVVIMLLACLFMMKLFSYAQMNKMYRNDYFALISKQQHSKKKEETVAVVKDKDAPEYPDNVTLQSKKKKKNKKKNQRLLVELDFWIFGLLILLLLLLLLLFIYLFIYLFILFLLFLFHV